MNQPTDSSAGIAASAHTDHFARDHLPPPELWPELRFDLPELQYPPRLNCVEELLKGAAGFDARTAILDGHGSWTYAGLRERVDRIAHVLRGPMGLEAGNRVLLRGANNPMTVSYTHLTLPTTPYV